MFNENDPYFVHPPAGVKAKQLGALVHDAKVVSAKLDQSTGDCIFSFLPAFDFATLELPEDAIYSFVFAKANRLVVTTYRQKPGVSIGAGVAREQDGRRREWYSQYRAESVAWSFFESQVTKEADGDIYDAELISGQEAASMQIHMSLAGSTEYYEIEIASALLSCTRSDGWTGQIDELLKLAEEHWEAVQEGRIV
jgi:hypothetical protein